MTAACLICLDPDSIDRGRDIAQALGLDFETPDFNLQSAPLREQCRFYGDYLKTYVRLLLYKETGLSLLTEINGAPVEIQADFCDATTDYRRTRGGGKSQMIAKAVGLKDSTRPRVLDGTAGLGADGFVLASLGCEVHLLERNPLVHALLADGIERGKASDLQEISEIMNRMHLLTVADALECLASTNATPEADVIYLDPMFPERDKSALVKKSMRVFHDFVGSDSDSDALLPLALERAGSRVVVKRPRHAPPLAGVTPSHVL
ncbi:MAG: class I SAM-dependent methyltransferase, partial [Verrucomicrobia bacterium]|nr:class I SAM-dependent methyltransferase [Verrucomicrobiota bacterium]